MPDETKNPVIPVFMACDSEYIPFAMTAILSALHHSKRNLIFHILHDGSVSHGEQNKCQALIRNNSGNEIRFSVWKNHQNLTTGSKRFPPLVYVRLLLPEMFPQYDRGIFLDADILIDRDLGELFDTDMKEKLIGAVPQREWTLNYNEGKWIYDTSEKEYSAAMKYFNTGILLMDMAGLRRLKLSEIVIQHQNEKFRYPEQDLMNRYLRELIFELDDCWNYIVPSLQLPQRKIFHYIDKPWRNSSVLPATRSYWKALQSTPWFYRGRAELLLYEIEASINSDWRYPGDGVAKAGLKLMGCFLSALYRRMKKRRT